MEHLSPQPPDDERRGPEHDRLGSGEIDMTGVVRQRDALTDVIGDALHEAGANGGEIPEWGARTLARALANERDDPLNGALHHYAVTGRADLEAMARELSDLYETATDDEVCEWINWLGAYVCRLPDTEPRRDDGHNPVFGSPLDQVGNYLRHILAEADTRGEPIAAEDAQAIATLLAVFVAPGSELARFADTGDANPVLLHEECQFVRRVTKYVPGAVAWIEHFEQHLASRSDLGRHSTTTPLTQPPSTQTPEPATEPDSPQVAQGINEHGDAFRAYLQLPDVDPTHDDLLQGFRNVYQGSVASMSDLLAMVRSHLSEAANEEDADISTIDDAALEQFARMAWDIVEVAGWLHMFWK